MLNKETRFITVSVLTYMEAQNNSSLLGILFQLN